MRIAKIKNKYLFNSTNPNGTHDYLVYIDTKTGENRAVELTHLYNPDIKRFNQIKIGLLKKMSFSHRDTPSGVKNKYHRKDTNGNPLNFNDICVDLNSYKTHKVTNKQASDVIKFAKKPNK
jgi:hypothetical protein